MRNERDALRLWRRGGATGGSRGTVPPFFQVPQMPFLIQIKGPTLL